jgi:hypothetical protein
MRSAALFEQPAEYLPERCKMMQQWSDYLDKLSAGAAMITFYSKEFA